MRRRHPCVKCGRRLPKAPPPSKRKVPEGEDVVCACGQGYSGRVLDCSRRRWLRACAAWMANERRRAGGVPIAVPWCPTCGQRVRAGLRTGLDGYRLAPCGHIGFPDWLPEVPS